MGKGTDPATLRQRYRDEREKRLGPGGTRTYTHVQGALADRYDTDPWAIGDGTRESVSWELEALIVGGGIAGMLAGGALRKHGVAPADLCIVERGADFGGTWYWNRYPGLACDTEAYCYLPLLEETGYVPREKYARGPELLEHSQRVGRHFGLYERALFQTRVVEAAWDEEQLRWIATTDRGDVLRARFLWLCAGATNRPKLPGAKGIERFRGHSFHTMRWDYGYTGGGPDGHMVNLKDKRVGVIGTGCTSIQCVPPLAEWSKELYVFQRTPSIVNIRANRPTDPDWAARLEPGWQRTRMENFLNILDGEPEDEDLVDDEWTRNFREVPHYAPDIARRKPADARELADVHLMDKVRARIDSIVHDHAVAEALKPWYGALCKRPTFHDEYLQSFNKPNVTLVDTHGRGVEQITDAGVIANGREYPLDAIVFATGFDVGLGLASNLGFEPRGVGGITFTERWAREFSTLHGMLISGFPNLFFIGGMQGTLATTRTYDMSIQTEHCATIMEHCRQQTVDRVEVRTDAERSWLEDMAQSRVDHTNYFHECTPGLFNQEGNGEPIWNYYYGKGPVAYRRVLERWISEKLTTDLSFGATRPTP
ncbi:MAG: NAD(P)/FAD-dependent oxidoreductase [Mycobacterium sp.]